MTERGVERLQGAWHRTDSAGKSRAERVVGKPPRSSAPDLDPTRGSASTKEAWPAPATLVGKEFGSAALQQHKVL